MISLLLAILAHSALAAPFDGPPIPGEPSRWSRLPGVWYDAPPAGADVVGVVEGALVFRGFAAARLDAPLPVDSLHLSAWVDPVVGDTTSLGWVSFMLEPEPGTLGWVTSPTNTFGLLVRSNGALQLFSRGVEVAYEWEVGPPALADGYALELRLRAEEGGARLSGTLGGAAFSARLGAVAPTAYLSVGAHYHEAPVASVVSALRVRSR